ncbi:hypothetical protein SAMN04489761_3420 [Tenacibaculum sp. MAR_2009_124]|uniref:hypothetical protein n=1 Tax=Tenacibaculum sp. MAR_2009_124 TaxID=1250059 RepID=UPI000898A915|nr:hypothetical protein [Tenacibaculum sp. MAR_2009_124]SEC65802.1 hypothetical protein SAMN04489761_3420 [Tenacibaculum sp. MAR_2009_124]
MKKAKFHQKFMNEYSEREFNPNETLQWLKANISILWSWGFQDAMNLMNKGLIFKVNGYHHRGWVLITLAFNDTYTVRFLNHKYEETKEKEENVYCDELQDRIDTVIEKVDLYKM